MKCTCFTIPDYDVVKGCDDAASAYSNYLSA